MVLARKRFSDEDVIRLLRQIEVETAFGASVAQAFLSLLGTRRFMTRCFSRSNNDFPSYLDD